MSTGMEQDQPSENGVERRLDEMAAMVEDMRRQQSEMKSEMQRQAELHEAERKRWHKESQKMQEDRENLLKQGADKSKPKITGLHMSSRVIGGSKASGSHSFLGNRTRNFHSFSDAFKDNILELMQHRRELLTSHLTNLRKATQAVEAEQTARALDTLSISEQTKKPSPLPSPPPPAQFSNYQDKLKESYEACQRQFEDLTKRRRMQQQLSSVLHAQNCERNQVDALGYATCFVPLCSVTSKVLEHMRTCTFVTKCPTPMCSLTREVLDHYKNCKTDDCDICKAAKLESISTREHLLKFMDTISNGLDEEASVETPSVPSTPVNPDATDMPGLPRMFTPLLPGGALFPMEMPSVIADLVSQSSINPIGGLFPQTSTSMFLPPPWLSPSMIFMRRMAAQTEGTSAETKMEGSDAHE